MADDARTKFVEGLKVTANHLQHLQDSLRQSIDDLRTAVGLGRIAWGLRVTPDTATTSPTGIAISPGVAFSLNGARLALDEPVSLLLPEGTAPWRVVLQAQLTDQVSLRVDDIPTLIQRETLAIMESQPSDGALNEDALVIAEITEDDETVTISQPDSLFATVGHHTHSGQHVQDSQGRWHFDGAPLNLTTIPGPMGDKGDKGDAGQPGPTGDKGDTGQPGSKGDAGEQGPKGDTGDKGDTGQPGPMGDKGDKGDKGNKGNKGDPGDPGFSPDQPYIEKLSWDAATPLPVGSISETLREMSVGFTQKLSEETTKPFLPLLVAMYIAYKNPETDLDTEYLISVNETRISMNQLLWKVAPETIKQIQGTLDNTGAATIRIDVACDYLVSADGLQASANGGMLIGLEGPFPPGGIFRSWLRFAQER